MKRVSMSVALGFALSCGIAHSVLAQDGLDVTMRVLDDVKDVDAVIREIEDGKDTLPGERGDQGRGDGADGEEQWTQPNGHDDLDEGDADHGDGKYEDHDVPIDEVG